MAIGGSDSGNSGVSPTRPLATINAALSVAPDRSTILVGAGTYDSIVDHRAREDWVTVAPWGDEAPAIQGADLRGAQYLRLTRMSFSAPLLISNQRFADSQQDAHHIDISDSTLTVEDQADDTAAITIRSSSAHVSVRGSRFFNAMRGITGPGNTNAPPSSHITIAGNTFSDMEGDGIAFGDWDDVIISDNTIRNVSDPAGEIHNDGIQLFGNSRRVAIVRNTIERSDGQLLFIQAVTGPIDDLLVENNLLCGSSGYAVVNAGATNLRFLYNTAWTDGIGGLLIRSGKGDLVPDDAVVVGNIVTSLNEIEGAFAAVRDHNLIARTTSEPRPHELVEVDPAFTDPEQCDLRLRPESPARRAGEAILSPETDRFGKPRCIPPSLGAFE